MNLNTKSEVIILNKALCAIRLAQMQFLPTESQYQYSNDTTRDLLNSAAEYTQLVLAELNKFQSESRG